MQDNCKIAIIIVNYNNALDTIECLQSLNCSSNNDFNVIVVDNNSVDIEYQKLKEYCVNNSKITLIQSDRNGGFAYANNIGITHVREKLPECEYYWLLNNDTKVFPDTIDKILKFATNVSKDVGVIGNKLLFYDNPRIIQAVGGRFNKYSCRCCHIGAYEEDIGQYDKCDIRMDYVVGASMLIKKQFIESVGLMTEDYFLYFEELDWIERGKRLGWRIAYNCEANVLHKEGGSTHSREKISIEIGRIQLRSRILFMKRFYPQFLFCSIWPMLLMIGKYLVKGEVDYSLSLIKTFVKTMLYE